MKNLFERFAEITTTKVGTFRKDAENLLSLANGSNIIRMCWYASRGYGYDTTTKTYLQHLGFVEYTHFNLGNDAPRGGKVGAYLKLTAKGRTKMNFITRPLAEQNKKDELQRQANQEAYDRERRILKAKRKFEFTTERNVSEEANEILTKFFANEEHPCPADVMELKIQFKREFNIGWRQLRGIYAPFSK